jgi:hypothetical protein
MNGKDWYQQQLQTPQWKEKRREIYKRDSFSCVDCGQTGVTMECHHNHYVRGKEPWNYPAYALVTVYGDCHEKRHKARILKHDSHEDAEMWYLFADLEAAILEENLALRSKRIERLERKGAVWEQNGRFYGLVDKKGRERFFDEDGNEM